jgi:hypothetical protein
MIAAGGVVALVALGGIAFALDGAPSGHETETSSTTTAAASPTSTTDVGAKGADESGRLAALCHALHQGSARGQAMKAAHGQAFQNLDCTNVVEPGATNNQGGASANHGPPETSNAGGNGGGQGPGTQGTDNPHAVNGQSHKP